jgi:hypothetical protein
VTYVQGSDGFPAFSINRVANLRSPAQLIVPPRLDEFAIMAIFRSNKPPEGFLFSIINSLESVIQLGVKVASSYNNINISLIYNDPSTDSPSESLVTFEPLPYEPKHWLNIAFQVMNDRVTL